MSGVEGRRSLDIEEAVHAGMIGVVALCMRFRSSLVSFDHFDDFDLNHHFTSTAASR